MHPLKISLISLGSLKHPVNMEYLENLKSQLIAVKHGASIGHLPNAEGENWEYTCDQIKSLVKADNEADFTLALINAPLENNYYMHRLSDNVGVLSLYEMAEIVRYSNFTVENFILRNLYELAVLYTANGGLVPSDAYTWAHDDVRGCLFDMNSNKSDIIFSMHQPTLCDSCKARVLAKQVSSGFLPKLENELSAIRKELYFRMMDWVKTHPILALIITAISAIALNLVASIIFETAKPIMTWLS
jgi:hypothetical protein